MEKYIKIRKIGEGAFGKANLVRHKQKNSQLVIKEINIIRMSAKEREESRKEVAVLAQLNHPNIVTYRESFEEHGNLYIVMDFCAGGDLYNKINTQRGILLSEDQILDWFVQMCLAIKHIHDRKILHRDIKSQNIFLTDRGMVQLGDFGIAKVLNSTVELARTCIGTPYYLSPEIVENKPYNNKSDIWSLGCVLYELTTLKHAFEAGNMKNLVLKIIRGSYPPVPPKYSYDIRNLIAQLFKRSPRDRPSINTILKKNFITQRVRKFLTEDELASEFSHTVMHGQKLARALPPPPKQDPGSRPSSAKRAPPKQGRYDPSAVYGAPFKKSRENRVSQEKKKKSGAGPNRPISSSFQDIQRKKQELIDKEKKRFEVQRKMARINRSREEGWRNIVDNLGSEERKNENKDQGREQLRGPVPRVQPVEEKKPMKDRGNYDQYHSYLDKIQRDREERVRQPAGNVQAPVWRKAPNPIHDVAQQAQYDRRLGGEAAERARLVEDYIQRKQEAQKNKARGHAQMYGYTPPSTPVPPKPVVKPARVVGAQFRPPSAGRNREEQEYLEKLRQIRQNNYADRQVNQAMMKNAAADNSRPSSARDDADVRKKKIEALRQQADERAQKLKDQLELKRKDMLEKEKRMWERQQNKFAERPSSAKKGPDLKPVAAVPITGALQAIGAKPPSEDPALAQESEDKSSLQQQKECILKRLNEKGSPRGNWGDPKTLKEEPPGEEPESSRSRWGGAGGDGPSLAQLPLEETASHMEATSARDRVIKNPEDAAAQLRRQWGRPGSTVMNALKDAPISSTLGSLQSDDSFSSQSSKEASPQPNVQSPPVVPPVKEAVAYTITLSKDKIGKDTVTISPTKENPPEGIDSTSEKSENEEKEKTVIVDLKSEQSEKPLDKPNAKDCPGETSQTDTESESKISGSQSEKNTMQTDFKSPDIQNDTSNKVISPVANPETKNQSDDSISKKLPEDKPESDKKGDNEETESDRSGKPLTPPKPPRVSSKPEIAPKPRVISTTITLAKPVLLSKPETAMDFGSKLPSVGKSVGAGSLFNKVELDENVDEKIEELKANMEGVVLENVEDENERPKTVFKGLSTGHFDMGDTKLLRTCSEPDLTKLTVPKSDLVKSGVLSQSVGNMTEIGEEDGGCGDKMEEEGDESEVQSSPDSVGAEADVEEDEDEDLDELMSVRETMRSILLQGSDDESPKGTVQFSLSATEEEDKQDKDGDSAEKDIVKANKNSDGDKDNEDSDDDKDNKMNEKGDNSDNVTNKKEDGEGNKDEFQSTSLSWSVSLDDENRSVTTEENDDLDLFQTDDSDDHDEDDCDDFELYSRLEESRVELENQLGCTKFLKVYKTVQALQEDEDENIEEGARIAMELLGKEHEGLYPRIFQLVMADAAFTEDNE